MTLRRARIALFVAGLFLSLSWPAVHSGNPQTSVQKIEKIERLDDTNRLAFKLDTNSAPIENPKVQWRRTANGWEPTSGWTDSGLSLPPAALHLHPAIVAMLQTLVSVGALLTFEFTDEDEADDLIHMFDQ